MIISKAHNNLNFRVKFKKKLKNQKMTSISNENFPDKEDTNVKQFSNPGKVEFSESEIREREVVLKILSDKWKQKKIEQEAHKKKIFGFSENSEVLNGRFAMSFLTIGIFTEYWTKQSIIDQVEIALRILGIF